MMLINKLFKFLAYLAVFLTSTLIGSAYSASNTMRVHFIDVGQGSATLVEFECGVILVDTGAEENTLYDGGEDLIDYLDDFFMERPDLNRTINLLVITHPHIDHTNNIKPILRNYNVLNALTNGQRTGSGIRQQKKLKRFASINKSFNYKEISVDEIPKKIGLTSDIIDPINCESTSSSTNPTITVLWGKVGKNNEYFLLDKQHTKLKDSTFENENNHSIAIKVEFGLSSALLSGDLEKNAIPFFLKHYEDTNLLDVDVILVNHHGSDNGINEAYLEATTPDYAVISMGPSNRNDKNKYVSSYTAYEHGHPRYSVINSLENRINKYRDKSKYVDVATGQGTFIKKQIQKAIYATGWDGNVVLEADTSGAWKVSYDGDEF